MAVSLDNLLDTMKCAVTHFINCMDMKERAALTAGESEQYRNTAIEMSLQLYDYGPVVLDLSRKLQSSMVATSSDIIHRVTEGIDEG